MNIKTAVSNAIKQLNVVGVYAEEQSTIDVITKAKALVNSLGSIEESLLNATAEEFKKQKEALEQKLNTLDAYVLSLQGMQLDDDVAMIATSKLNELPNIISGIITKYKPLEGEENKIDSIVSLEEIQDIIELIVSNLNFAISRIKQGKNDDLALNPINDVIDTHLTTITTFVNNFVNSNYDENDSLKQVIEELNAKILELSELDHSQKVQLGEARLAISNLNNEITMLKESAKAEKLRNKQTQEELKELKKIDPVALKRKNAEQKKELVELRSSNKTMSRNIQISQQTINFLRQELTSKVAQYDCLTESHQSIMDNLARLTGSAFEANLGYQSPFDENLIAYIYAFYVKRTIYASNNGKQTGERNVYCPHVYFQVRTNQGFAVTPELSEWGYVTMPIIKGLTDWFGRGIFSALQEYYDKYVMESHPELWERFKYLRSFKLKAMTGISEETLHALKQCDIENIAQIGSWGVDGIKSATGITKREATKLYDIALPYLLDYIKNNGDTDLESSRDGDDQSNIDKVIIESKKKATEKLAVEVPELMKTIGKTLSDIYQENISKVDI